MKRYALLMTLLVMLCGTEARAATIGFDSLPNGPYSAHTETPFEIFPGGAWSIEGTVGSKYASSNVTNSSLLVQLPFHVDPRNGRLIQDEFSVQGFDLSSNGGESGFTIQGLHGVDVQVFRFTFNTTSNPFVPVSVANEALNNTTFTFTNFVDFDTNPTRPFNVDIDKVERLIITATHGFNITSGVDCIKVGGVPSACSSGGGDPNAGGGVPEPASLLLLGAGLAGIGIWRRKATR